MLKEDMEYLGPVRVKNIDEAQRKIVFIAKQLNYSGKIKVSKKDN